MIFRFSDIPEKSAFEYLITFSKNKSAIIFFWCPTLCVVKHYNAIQLYTSNYFRKEVLLNKSYARLCALNKRKTIKLDDINVFKYLNPHKYKKEFYKCYYSSQTRLLPRILFFASCLHLIR